MSLLLQRYQDSNLEMLESESSALPFGESPMSFAVCRNDKMYYIITKNKMQALFSFFLKFFVIFLQFQYSCGFPAFISLLFFKMSSKPETLPGIPLQCTDAPSHIHKWFFQVRLQPTPSSVPAAPD